jgi:hypothetical protein
MARSHLLGPSALGIGVPRLGVDPHATVDPLGVVNEVEPSAQVTTLSHVLALRAG